MSKPENNSSESPFEPLENMELGCVETHSTDAIHNHTWNAFCVASSAATRRMNELEIEALEKLLAEKRSKIDLLPCFLDGSPIQFRKAIAHLGNVLESLKIISSGAGCEHCNSRHYVEDCHTVKFKIMDAEKFHKLNS